MEKQLQGPFNSCLAEEDLGENWLEEFVNNFGNNNCRFEDPIYCEEICLEDKMPFLQMLHNVEVTRPTASEPNYFQLLLRLQQEKLIAVENHPNFGCNFRNPSELDSSLTINPVKSETCREESPQKCIDQNHLQGSHLTKTSSKRKRKRPSKPTKNKEEVETQRMTHIAVERNRRRQMNDHLTALRSLMPPSYVQRGDQASIIGGAIDYVKQMEQLLESLQAQKRLKQSEDQMSNASSTSSITSSSSNINNNNSMFMMTSSQTPIFQFRNFDFNEESNNGNSILQVIRRNNNDNEEFSAENRSDLGDIKVVVIQKHVNLKIQCQRRPGQLIKAMVAFEELRLTILHLNITSLHSLVHYSFNLKIEDDCKLGSADDVVRAVHHIFSLINLG